MWGTLQVLFTFSPAIVAGMAAGAICFSLSAGGLLVWQHYRISRLMLGRSGASLEESIVTLARRTKDLEGFQAEAEKYLKIAEGRIASSIHGVATVRFNPFKGDGSGGNQSSSVALITEMGEGVVISTLFSRERVSVFSKPLIKGTSIFELTEEEKEAVRLAKENAARK